MRNVKHKELDRVKGNRKTKVLLFEMAIKKLKVKKYEMQLYLDKGIEYLDTYVIALFLLN